MHRKVIVAGVGLAAFLLLIILISGGLTTGAAQPARPVSAASIKSSARTTARKIPPTAIIPPLPARIDEAAPPPTADLTALASATEEVVQAQPVVATPEPAAEPAALPDPTDRPTSIPVEPTAVVHPSGPVPTPSQNGASPAALNDIAIDQIIVMPPAVQQHVREIYARGQRLGREARSFSKVGDSTMVWPPFMAAFDSAYQLGPYQHLQSAVERYSGSFARNSFAAHKGMHSWEELAPSAADHQYCRADEGPLQCEFRVNNPSVAIIRLGANDYAHPDRYEESLRKIVEYLLNRGSIPVLGTKPDRLDGPDNTLNKIVTRLAGEYSIPLWDYDRVACTVPNNGLLPDRTHFADGGSHNYASAETYQHGDSLEDLTALMMLDSISRQLLTVDYPNG